MMLYHLEQPIWSWVPLTTIFLVLAFALRVPADEFPNVIIVYTDDQGYGDVSCLNPLAKFETPNLDRIAREGIHFKNAHSADTVCTPSRYSLLTGRYCWRTKRKKGVLGAEGECLIPDNRLTIASMLRNQGYDTAMIGKWHLGMDFPGTKSNRDWSQPIKDMPLDKGFDYFYGIPASLNFGILAWFEGRYATNPPTLYTAKKKNRRHLDYRIKPPFETTPEETRSRFGKNGIEIASDFIDNQCLARFTDKAIKWLESRTTNSKPRKPFFLYLPLTSPHYPVCPLPEFWGKGKAGGYGEFVIETDFHVGRILKFLDDHELTENTLVIFTSDNGPEKSWKQRIEQFNHDSRGGFRGGKRDIYEGGHRVPFLVRWPGGIQNPGRACNDLIGQVDIFSTLAQIIKFSVPDFAAEDSQSFAPVFKHPAKPHFRQPLINHSASGRFSVTRNNWKLILPHNNQSTELYDLAFDPAETTNIVKDHNQIAADLEKQINRIILNGRTTIGQPQPNDTGHWKDLTWIAPDVYNNANTR